MRTSEAMWAAVSSQVFVCTFLRRDCFFTLSYLLLDPKPKISRCPWESVAAKCCPSGLHLQSNNAPCPWPSIYSHRQKARQRLEPTVNHCTTPPGNHSSCTERSSEVGDVLVSHHDHERPLLFINLTSMY